MPTDSIKPEDMEMLKRHQANIALANLGASAVLVRIEDPALRAEVKNAFSELGNAWSAMHDEV